MNTIETEDVVAAGGGRGAPGALPVAAVVLGTLTIAALTVGRLMIGRLSVGRSYVGRLQVDELVVGTLRVGSVERQAARLPAGPATGMWV